MMLTDLKSQACHKPILGLTVDGARNAEANTEGAPPESRLRQEGKNLLRIPVCSARTSETQTRKVRPAASSKAQVEYLFSCEYR
ncbi:hypothetical protein E4U13_003234, partial [Claviceps humidiphila]